MDMNEQQAKKIKLSKNFTLWEFLESDNAKASGLMKKQLEIEPKTVVNLACLCKYVLQPASNNILDDIFILSGYRCKELNDITTGSSPTSDHVNGLSADIKTKRLEDLFNFIKDNVEFDQLIYYKDRNFIHVSRRNENNRNQVIIK